MSELEFNKILEKFNFNKDNWEFDIEFDCVGKVILKGKFNEELILSNLYEILEVTDSSITLQNMRDNKKLIVTGTFHSIHLQYGCNEYTAYTIAKLHRVVTRL